MRRLLFALLLAAPGIAIAQGPGSSARLRTWRTAHEVAILRELFDFLSIPNVAANRDDIQRNADALKRLFERRRFTADVVATAGSPLLLAERRTPGVARTVTFYFHYDGQPVDPKEWVHSPPFTPVFVTGAGPVARVMTLDQAGSAFDPGWRIYGRSSSDDKSPIIALLATVDALDALGVGPTSNVRVILEGDEEAGSPSLDASMTAHGDRVRSDLLVMVDGPRHASGLPTVFFGARGIMSAIVTVYGPSRDLHSGNYGNWAPNPALMLSKLLASMKDDRGRVTIEGFYDDVVPLTPAEKRALDEIPNVEPTLMKEFGFSRPENPTERLEVRHNLPTLNIAALDSGGGTGGQGRTVIPASASARLDLRMVKAVDPARQFERLVAHVRKAGYFISDTEPTPDMRAAHPAIARVTRSGGYPAGRTSMEEPIAKMLVAALSRTSSGGVVRLPTIGGSAPFYVFTDHLRVPTIGLSIVNFDNNQHGPNENLRLQNFWEGIEQLAAILTM